MKKRIKRVIGNILIILSTLVAYALFCLLTNIGIPCPFYLVTGLKCPGCGITRMFLSIINLDFSGAFKYNPVVFTSLPVLISIFIRIMYVYIKTGKSDPGKFWNVIIYLQIGILVVFGVLRNII